ncbi:MAG: hypothetical protein HY077_04755 [Elusimicrobia bacterium]|nr:hypothetical protein [Elusimicrobiota bacterium]
MRLRDCCAAAALALAGCGAPGPSTVRPPLAESQKLDIRLCLSEDTPKRKLGAAVRHRYYTERRPPFKRVHLMPHDGLTRRCDIIAVLTSSDNDSGTHRADAVSPVSNKTLFSASAEGALTAAAASLADQLFAAFDRGTALHDAVIAERDARAAAHPLPPQAPGADEDKAEAEGPHEP